MLFGTKKELFIAGVRRAFERTVAAFRRAAAEAGDDADAQAVLMAMAHACHRLLEDRTLLLIQLQAYAACDDPDVREAVRVEFLRLVRFVQGASGAPDDAVQGLARAGHAHERGGSNGSRGRGRGLGAHVPGLIRRYVSARV
jgi:AcrR family transcriptional regulator